MFLEKVALYVSAFVIDVHENSSQRSDSKLVVSRVTSSYLLQQPRQLIITVTFVFNCLYLYSNVINDELK